VYSVVLLAARAQEPVRKAADEPLLKVNGELTRDDPVDPVLRKGFHKVYPVKLAAGMYYQIDLISKDFDAYLRLEGAKGNQLAEDDDSGGELNARIVHKAEHSDSYRVIATTCEPGETGKFLLTVKKIDEAEAKRQKLLNDATTLEMEGRQWYHQAKLPEATERLQKALEMRQTLYPKDRYPHGHRDLGRSLTWLGRSLEAQGEYARAEPFYRQALEICQTLYPKDKYPQGHRDLGACLNNLGLLLQIQGEFAQAEPFLRHAVQMAQTLYPKDKYPHGHSHLVASLNNLAAVLQDQGKYGQAEPFYRQALEISQTLYRKDKYPQGHPDLSMSLFNLGGLFARHGEYGKAEPFMRQALEIQQALYPREKYPQGHPDLATALNGLGFLLVAQGEPGKAEPLYQQALEMNQALYPKATYPQGHPNLAISLDNLGALLLAQGKFSKAEPFYRHALEMNTQLANRLAQVAPEPVALNAAATFPISRDTFLSVTRHLPGSDTPTYEAVWHSRAALTRVYQRRHFALIAAATDDSIRKAWDHLQALRRQREEFIMTPAPKDPSNREENLRRLNKQIDTVELELQPQLPAVKHYEDLAELGPKALRKLLPADAVLIDFLRYIHFEDDPEKPGKEGKKRSFRYVAFVVSRQDVRRVELGTATEIDTTIREWRAAITAELPGGNDSARKEHEAKLTRQAAALRQRLWEPVEKRLPPGTATVYLVPDAELTQLPWAALPGKGKDSVVLDDFALAVLPHGPFLLEQLTPPPPRSAKRLPAPEGLLLAGGIRYDDQPSATVVAARAAENVVGQRFVWDYLKGTDNERRVLTKVMQKSGPKLAANLSGTEAATARLRHELEHCRYAHIATHGFFADAKFRSVLQLDPKLFERRGFGHGDIGQPVGEGARSPLVLSGLVCAGANVAETPERGILSADAIAGLLLDDLHLAVMSACDTGIGDVAGGEGVFGLQRAFHIAGCKNVVASLWKVDDAATAALMTRFYGYLFAEDQAKRLPPIEALRRAQLDLYRHPELIPAWAKGDQRGPGLPRPATTPAPPGTPPELLTSEGRAPIRLWAAFTLSGLGR
jgi:CHAT domain-containing protein/Tfp pilus assembly protein PilF